MNNNHIFIHSNNIKPGFIARTTQHQVPSIVIPQPVAIVHIAPGQQIIVPLNNNIVAFRHRFNYF